MNWTGAPSEDEPREIAVEARSRVRGRGYARTRWLYRANPDSSFTYVYEARWTTTSGHAHRMTGFRISP